MIFVIKKITKQHQPHLLLLASAELGYCPWLPHIMEGLSHNMGSSNFPNVTHGLQFYSISLNSL